MRVGKFIELIRSTILYNIDLGTLAEVEVRCNNKILGYITGCKVNDYKIILHDSKFQSHKFKVIDLLSQLRRAKDGKGRKDKEVIYSPRYGYNYDIISVYFRVERDGHQVKYIKFHVNVQ